jgi:hypothetical protein
MLGMTQVVLEAAGLLVKTAFLLVETRVMVERMEEEGLVVVMVPHPLEVVLAVVVP